MEPFQPVEQRGSPDAGAPIDEERRFSIHFGLFGRSPPFTRRQWRAFSIAATAGFFDNYDGALLSLALKQIQQGLDIAEGRLGDMLSMIRLGYLCALLLTPFADVFGRRRLLLYTVVGYTVFTGLSAAAPGERAFIVCQFFARAFAGAESIVALVIVAEEVDAAVRGWSVGLLSALASIGYGAAAGVFALISVIPYGWRGLYALALLPLLLIIPLRRKLPETRRFEAESTARRRWPDVWRPVVALLRSYPWRLLMIAAVRFLSAIGASSAGIFFPKFLQEVHRFSPGNISALYIIGGGLGILGSIIAGWLSDRFGRRRMGALFMVLSPLLAIWMYTARDDSVMAAWVLELFFSTAADAIVSAFSAELFPTSFRSTAGSVQTVAGTTGGAIGLFLEGVLYHRVLSHWMAIRMLTVFWIIAPIILFVFFPETAGRELEAISPDEPSRAERARPARQ